MGLIEQIRARSPQTKILVLTASQNHATARLAMAAGADGYMLKHEEGDELFHAISLVLSGIRYVSKALIQSTEPLEIGASPSITTREKEILGLIANGYSSQDIARKLNVSVLTIRKHRQNLMTKLSLHNVAEVTAYAIRDGLSVKRRGEE
nr:Oxygen regulatory protein NreC [Paraburkholderia busanensis]